MELTMHLSDEAHLHLAFTDHNNVRRAATLCIREGADKPRAFELTLDGKPLARLEAPRGGGPEVPLVVWLPR